ncbi:MAG: hypothetical protein JOZ62_04105 [Acidobacteriaceae bacterium]|nr:hypothetical protein [Acidobacteriaceae bacterium]
MNDSQIIAIAIVFVAAIGSILYNNSRITDLRDTMSNRFNDVNRHIEDKFNLLDVKIDSKFNLLDHKIDSKFQLIDQKLDHLIELAASHESRIQKLEQQRNQHG